MAQTRPGFKKRHVGSFVGVRSKTATWGVGCIDRIGSTALLQGPLSPISKASCADKHLNINMKTKQKTAPVVSLDRNAGRVHHNPREGAPQGAGCGGHHHHTTARRRAPRHIKPLNVNPEVAWLEMRAACALACLSNRPSSWEALVGPEFARIMREQT